MVLGIQVAGFLFGLFMIYYSFLNYKRKEFSIKEFSFWLALWVVFIVVALFPYLLDPLVKSLKFARTFDLLVIIGFIFLTAVIFHTYTITRKTQRKMEVIVRELAMKNRKR